jgi:mono/diheme cytochrome c family protein
MTMRPSPLPSLVAVGLLAPIVVLSAHALAQLPQQRAAPPPAPASEPQASPDDIDGETMFATACGFCHQDGGRVAGRGPKLAGSKKSDEYLIDRIKKGKPGTMPAYARAFSEGQIIAILAYIRGLEDTGG